MKPNASHEASVAQNEAMGRHAKSTREVYITSGCGLHAEESPALMAEADTERNHSSRKAMSSVVCETSVGHTEKMGRPAKSSLVTQCLVFYGSQAEDSPATLDSIDAALTHSMRLEMMLVPQIENMGCLANTSVEVEDLFSMGLTPMSLQSYWVRQEQ